MGFIITEPASDTSLPLCYDSIALTLMRPSILILLFSVAGFSQTALDPRAKADCEETGTRLTSLMSALPKDAARPKACSTLREEAVTQLRLAVAVEKAACQVPNAKGLTVPLKAQIDRRSTASDRLLDMMRECEEVMKAAESAQPTPLKKPQEITSCVIYKQSWDDRQIDKQYAAIRKADPEGTTCKIELPKTYAAHCGAQKTAWPQQEFSADLAALIKLSLDMSRCQAELQIKK